MTDEEYKETQDQLILLARLVSGIDLSGFIARASLAESVGPIFHPTLFREASRNLRDVKALAQSLQPFKAEIRRQVGGEQHDRAT